MPPGKTPPGRGETPKPKSKFVPKPTKNPKGMVEVPGSRTMDGKRSLRYAKGRGGKS